MLGDMKNLIPLSEVSEFDKCYTYKFYEECDVVLEHSRPIKRGVIQKEELGETGRDSSFSSRVADGGLRKGIQYYRMWFRFLKLALECEEKQIEVVVKPNTYTKRLGGQTTFHIPRETKILSVDKDFYADWDLDLVLTQTFDRWWKNHRQLFQSQKPEVITSKSIQTDDDHIYLKIDKTFNWDDLVPFLSREVRPNLNQPSKFEIVGKGRSMQLVNRYNAVVLSMNGVSPKEIISHPSGYVRSPDEKGDRANPGGAPEMWQDKKTGKINYSSQLMRLYKGGIFHLLEVCEGRFGKGVG